MLLQAKSPWDSPMTAMPSPLGYERHTTPEHQTFLSSLNPMDSAYCGRADAAWGEGNDEPRSARVAQLQQQQQLRPTGSAPSTLSRRYPSLPICLHARPACTQQLLGMLCPARSSSSDAGWAN